MTTRIVYRGNTYQIPRAALQQTIQKGTASPVKQSDPPAKYGRSPAKPSPSKTLGSTARKTTSQTKNSSQNYEEDAPSIGQVTTNSNSLIFEAIESIKQEPDDVLPKEDVWPSGALKQKVETLSGYKEDTHTLIKKLFSEQTNGSSFVNERQFLAIMTKKFNFVGADRELKALFKRFDIDRSGTVSVDEFANAMSLQKGVNSAVSLIGRIREALAKRAGGVATLKGFARQFKLLDTSNNGTVDHYELEVGFNKFLRAFGIQLTGRDIDVLFEMFDVDENGSISYDEFVKGIRGPMNDRRRDMVKLAFNQLDDDRNGMLSLQEIAAHYDVSGHPQVKAGRMSELDALKAFLRQWKLHSKNHDDYVTRDEFIDYYEWISSSIDNDDYFELMMRNAWHIAGGKGAAANTANLRVLVTHMDGRQTVEVVQNDLGLRPDDIEGIKKRLLQQGIKAKAVSVKNMQEI